MPLRRLLHPFPESHLLPGHLLSPLDIVAERIGIERTEAFFRESPAMATLVRAFCRFIGDTEGERLLKKEFHGLYELQLRAVALRADPPSDHGFPTFDLDAPTAPLGALAARDLAQAIGHPVAAPPEERFTVLRLWLAIASWGLLLPLRALAIWVRHGAATVTPRRVNVAFSEFLPSDLLARFRTACHDNGVADDQTLVVMESGLVDLSASPLPTIDPNTMPVARGAWLRRVVLPSLRLVWAVTLATWCGRHDRRVVEMARRVLNRATNSLLFRRIAENVACRHYVDCMDTSAYHNLRAIIFRQAGAGMVRWPYTQVDGPNITSSYMAYDLFLAGGDNRVREFGGTWWPHCRTVPVGQIPLDRRMVNDADISGPSIDEITARLAAGRKMAVYFCGNEDGPFLGPGLDLLTATWQGLAGNDQWFLVVKPKKTKFGTAFFDAIRADKRLRGFFDDANVIFLDFSTGTVPPIGWFIRRMALGVTLPGSAQYEALVRAIPMLVYFPLLQDTTVHRHLRQSGILFDDLDALSARIRALTEGTTADVPVEWLKERFDPFADDCAFDRIVQTLYCR